MLEPHLHDAHRRPARVRRRHQGLRPDRGAVGLLAPLRAGARPCPDGQERLGQVDAGQAGGRASSCRPPARSGSTAPTPPSTRRRTPSAPASSPCTRSCRWFPSLSIGENIFLGRLPMTRKLGVADRSTGRGCTARRRRSCTRWGWISNSRSGWRPPSASASSRWSRSPRRCRSARRSCCSTSRRRRSPRARSNLLFTLVRRLRERGVTILYITHRMNELFEIADTCTVLRDGLLAGSVEMAAGHAAPRSSR